MAASIFNGTAIKILKKILRFKDSNVEIITGDSDDPTVVAKDAPAGSLYIRSGVGELYIKRDSGSSTNWTKYNSSGASGSVQFSDGSGGLSSDPTRFFWDNSNDRLGIGTNAPQYKLDIFHATDATASIRNTANAASYLGIFNGAAIAFVGVESSVGTGLFGSGDGNALAIGQVNNHVINFHTNGSSTPRLRISSSDIQASLNIVPRTHLGTNLGTAAKSFQGIQVQDVDSQGNMTLNANAGGNITLYADTEEVNVASYNSVVAPTLKLFNAAGTQSVGIKSDDSLTTGYTLTLPTDDGAAGDMLVTDGSGVLSWASSDFIPTSEKGAANGVAELDAGGKVPVSQLPSALMSYEGTWDASTNTPTLADGVGDAGDVYIVSAAGTQNLGSGNITFAIGDWIIYNGTIWQKSTNADAVVSVNGFTGVVVLDTDDVSEGATNLYYTDSRVTSALTGAVSPVLTTDLTANLALVSDGSGKIAVSTVTDTELALLSGLTGNITTDSNIQTLTNKNLIDNSTFFQDNADNSKQMQFQLSGVTTGTTRTLTVPNADTTLVGTDVSQTLTNKTLDDSTTEIQDNLDNSKKFRFQASGITTATTRTLTVPDADTTIVGTDATQTLTNKSMVDSSTYIIDNTDNTKRVQFELSGVTTGTTRTLTVPDLSSTIVVTTGEQYLTQKKFPDGIDTTFYNGLNISKQLQLDLSQISLSTTRTATFPDASLTVVGTDTTQTLTNKDIDGGTASNARRITVPKDTKANLDALTRKEGTVVYATDLARPHIDNGTTLTPVALGQGQINYILNPDAEASTVGWNTYADTAGAAPTDGNGGSPTITWTRTTTFPLRGNGSFLFTKDAANRQGEGAAYAFTIDSADTSKVMQISFDYSPQSGTYSGGTASTDSDLTVYVYDITGATVIQPVSYKIDGAVVGQKYTFRGTFQATTNTSYRLIFHVATTSASAYSFKFDNVVVGPQVSSYVANVTDWQSYTPTGSWSTNTTYTGRWRRVGDTMHVEALVSTSGAPTTATLSVNLPSGYSIDTTKIAAADQTVVGTANAQDTGLNNYSGVVWYGSTTSVQVGVMNAASTYGIVQLVTQALPFTFGAGDSVKISFAVPISGWASQTPSAAESEGRVVAAKYTVTAGPTITTTPTIVNFANSVLDTHAAVTTGASWKFTAPLSGYYRVSLFARYTGSSASYKAAQVYKNGVADSVIGANSDVVTAAPDVSGSTIVQLNSGDYIDVRMFTSTGTQALNTNATENYITVERIMGNAVPYAQETVAARYSSSASNSIANNSFTIVDFATKEIDTHGAVTTGASWKFTAPVSGLYQISAVTAYTFGTWAAASIASRVYKNAAAASSINVSNMYNSGGGSADVGNSGTTIIRLNAGDYIDLRLFQNSGGAKTLNGQVLDNHIEILKVGN